MSEPAPSGSLPQEETSLPAIDPSTPDSAAFAQLDVSDEDTSLDFTLPDFSDDEAPAIPAASSSSSARHPPLKVSKGGPGKKKVPLSQLKAKLGSLAGGGAVVKKAKAKAAEEEEVGGKGMHLSEEMLDKVMAQLAVEQGPELASSIQRIDVQKLVAEAGINKAFLQGKEGLMGKGTKDMACVVSLLWNRAKLTSSSPDRTSSGRLSLFPSSARVS